MTIAALIAKKDNAELVRDAIAAILAVETAQQQTFAASVAATPTRADDSDYTATAEKDSGARLEDGEYIATAGTLTAGVGTWTCVAPSGVEGTCTTTAADDDLEFPTLGITFAVTAVSEPWDTGDVLTVWSPDPELWRLRVYKERTAPWGAFLTSPTGGTEDAAPIVNVWFDRETFNESNSDYIERQAADGKIHVDVYGYGKAEATQAGHIPADLKASTEAHRAMRLVRNILMAAEYMELGLSGTVGKRFPDSITAFQPSDADRPVQNIIGMRLVLAVTFNELSPQVELIPCGGILARVHTEVDGEVVMSVEYDFS